MYACKELWKHLQAIWCTRVCSCESSSLIRIVMKKGKPQCLIILAAIYVFRILIQWAIFEVFHKKNLRVFFFSESGIRLSNLPKNYSKSLSWAWNLNKLFTVKGGNFKFHVQDSDLEYLFWQCEKHIALSDKSHIWYKLQLNLPST